MKFLVFGAGGVGGYFGGMLAKAGQEVWFIARGKHLAAMKKKGLFIHASNGSFRVKAGRMTDNPGKVPPPDVVLFCVKAYDTESAAEQLAPILSDTSIVISLQNGMENEGTIKRCIPHATVYGGAAYIFSNVTAPGRVTEWGGPRRIVFGPLAGKPGGKAKEIEKLMKGAGIDVMLSSDMITELWKKFIFIAAGGGFNTLSRLALADILAIDESREVFYLAMKEAEAVARAKGIALPIGFVEQQLENLKSRATTARTSMYYDLVHQKPMEVEELVGAIVRYGREVGVPTPINQTVYASLLPHHRLHLQRKKVRTPKTTA
ncbi:MAG: 2-dehydropantoate 2-reductase [Bacteroidota bacterium]